MAEEINVGSLVKHKANDMGASLVVLQKEDSGHGYFEYECRWYNSKSGSYESGKFYSSELIGKKG